MSGKKLKARISIKLRYKSRVKPNVWRYEDIPNWIFVQAFVKRTFSIIREFQAQYEDGDGDRVTIVEMRDLADMFSFAHETGRKEMDVFITKVIKVEPFTVDEQDVSYVTQELRALKQQVNGLERKAKHIPTNVEATRQELRTHQQTINSLESSLDNMLRRATLVNARNQKEVKKDRVAYDSGTIEPFMFVMAMDRLVTGYIHKCMQCVPTAQYFITPSWATFSAVVMAYSGNLVKEEDKRTEIETLGKLNRTLTSKLNIANYNVSQRQVVLKPEDYGHWSDDDDRYFKKNDDDGYWSC